MLMLMPDARFDGTPEFEQTVVGNRAEVRVYQAEKLDDIMTTFSAEAPPLMEAVESANESQVAAEIFVNPLTSNTIFSCRLVYGECEKNLKSAVDINTAHIQALNGKSEMSAEQAKEIREAEKEAKVSLDFCQHLSSRRHRPRT